jgi:hypothetical protein
MLPNTTKAQQLAHRLVELEQTASGLKTSRAQSAALAGQKLYQSLSRWIGSDGCHALFFRAREEARSDWPALEPLYLRVRSEPYVEGVAQSVEAFGETATADAIESMLADVIELLGRLIGVDMATNLIERGLPADEPTETPTKNRRREA